MDGQKQQQQLNGVVQNGKYLADYQSLVNHVAEVHIGHGAINIMKRKQGTNGAFAPPPPPNGGGFPSNMRFGIGTPSAEQVGLALKLNKGIINIQSILYCTYEYIKGTSFHSFPLTTDIFPLISSRSSWKIGRSRIAPAWKKSAFGALSTPIGPSCAVSCSARATAHSGRSAVSVSSSMLYQSILFLPHS
jgi:hypothetical protein